MAHIRVRGETKTLYFDFHYLKVRCREQTTLPDTKPNRKKLEAILQRIEAEITLRAFEYGKYFPNSAMVGKIAEIETKLKPGYTLSLIHI